jgi:Carboxypeptidase regulatory-like domain
MSQSRRFCLFFALFIVSIYVASCLGQARGPQSLETEPSISPVDQPTGTINGSVIDPSGAVIVRAQVTWSEPSQTNRQVSSDERGQFSFSNVPAGEFQLSIQAAGFQPQTFSGTLDPGQTNNLLPIMLGIGEAVTSVNVGVPQVEVAQEQLKVEEQQRVLGVVPNFYVSYIPDAAPLDARQKFQLALKTVIDPFTLVFVGAVSGFQQAQGHFEGYGQGAEGYGKRYGANYGDTVTGTFFGGAVFPWLLKQDPRYFYKGTGSTGSRLYYAISRAVICKGDNKRWQPNYSAVLGDLAAGGISNLYYPANDRNGAGLTFANAALGLAGGAVSNVFQEFVVPKFILKHKKDPIPSQIHGGAGEY